MLSTNVGESKLNVRIFQADMSLGPLEVFKVFCLRRLVLNLFVKFQEELCQTIIQLPDAVLLGSEIRSSPGVENLKLLLLLLLGCAVQCPNKEIFITRIKELPVEVQHNIVSCIKRVSYSLNLLKFLT